MPIQEKIINHYSGPSLWHILGTVPDLQKLRQVLQEKDEPCNAVTNSLQTIMEHLLIYNVPFWIAQEYVFPIESAQIKVYRGNVRNN